jgi:hypothetical protein
MVRHIGVDRDRLHDVQETIFCMTRILVSFCNVAPGALPLVVLNSISGKVRAVALPDALTEFHGITGLAACGPYLYAGVQGHRDAGAASPASILVLDRDDLSFCELHTCRLPQSVHSILATDDAVWAVSTGTDEVIRIPLDHGLPQDDEAVVWRQQADGSRADMHHLNAIAFLNGELLVSGFGRKTGPLWSSANDGFVVNTATSAVLIAGIDHPHSLLPTPDGLAYCESRTRSIHVNGRELIRGLPGYARGLCLHNGSLFVGTGVGRRVSVSTGLVNNRDDPGELDGQCAVVRVRADDGARERVFDLGAFGTEIYDLLPLD